jgi:ferredoxin
MSSEADGRLYVQVNLAKCCGYTTCADVGPDVFKLDEDGFAYVDDERVPLGLEQQAMAGADVCPERAIYVGGTPPPS